MVAELPAAGRVLALADRQHGVVLSRQLREQGVSDRVLHRLIRQGWLVPVRRGAWVIGRHPSPWQRTVAVSLLAGPSSALSHMTAARIHRFPALAAGPQPEVSVVYPRSVSLAGVSVHRVSDLHPCDVRPVQGIAVTTPARTLVDLAAHLPEPLVAKLFDEALISRSTDAAAVGEALDRVRPRPGVRVLRSLVEARSDRPVPESQLEARVVAALESLGPFEVHYQVVLEGRLLVLDVAWPEARVAIESDGWAVHARSRTNFDRDRRRDNLLAAHGWLTGHVTSVMSGQEILATATGLLLRRAAGAGEPR